MKLGIVRKVPAFITPRAKILHLFVLFCFHKTFALGFGVRALWGGKRQEQRTGNKERHWEVRDRREQTERRYNGRIQMQEQ